jgi:hypothetical protein
MHWYLALECGHPGFPQGCVPHGTWVFASVALDFRYWTVTIYGQLFQVVLLSSANHMLRTRNVLHSSLRSYTGFRLFRFRSPLTYGISMIYFPALT